MNRTGRSAVSNLTQSQHQIHNFFVDHLNQIYCAKSHLVERLPELVEKANFQDLRHAIIETTDDIIRQIARMEEIYTLLDEPPSVIACDELIGFIETGFTTIYQQNEECGLRDLAILFYLLSVQSVEVSAFQVLQIAAISLPDKQIRQLIQENADESKTDRMLFLEITKKYIS